jgi:hypothetical protein
VCFSSVLGRAPFVCSFFSSFSPVSDFAAGQVYVSVLDVDGANIVSWAAPSAKIAPAAPTPIAMSVSTTSASWLSVLASATATTATVAFADCVCFGGVGGGGGGGGGGVGGGGGSAQFPPYSEPAQVPVEVGGGFGIILDHRVEI